jgi:hypothetical protein
MRRQEIHKLLGGFATGTLTREEEQALFAAALEDHELFHQLVKEQPLRDLLQEPAARARLIAALEDRPGWFHLWWRPAAAALALTGFVLFAVLEFAWKPRPKPAETAENQPVEAPHKVYHAPSPFPISGGVKIAPPPEVVVPKLERRPLPVAVPPAPGPQAPQQPQAPEPLAETARPGVAGLVEREQPLSLRRSAVEPLRLSYTILRKPPAEEEFAPAGAEELRQGDSVRLRLASNQAGYLSLSVVDSAGALHLVTAVSITESQPVTTPVLPPGATKLQVSFSRHTWGGGPAFIPRTGEITTDAQRRTTEVTAPAAIERLSFFITLPYP